MKKTLKGPTEFYFFYLSYLFPQKREEAMGLFPPYFPLTGGQKK